MEITTPKIITYKEIMVVYGFNAKRAQEKLWVIRGILGKKQFQAVLIAEFCKAENVDRDIFESELKKAYTEFYQKPTKQLRVFS
jgi:hypothetical protein